MLDGGGLLCRLLLNEQLDLLFLLRFIISCALGLLADFLLFLLLLLWILTLSLLLALKLAFGFFLEEVF